LNTSDKIYYFVAIVTVVAKKMADISFDMHGVVYQQFQAGYGSPVLDAERNCEFLKTDGTILYNNIYKVRWGKMDTGEDGHISEKSSFLLIDGVHLTYY